MTTNQEMNELFNIEERRGAFRSTAGAVDDSYMFVHGYNINQNGYIRLPVIGVAGDMTDYGNRKLHIVRKTDKGRQFAGIDISDQQAIKSDFYLLHPNDVIYVEPMLAKRFALAQFSYAAFFTAISTVVLILNFIN